LDVSPFHDLRARIRWRAFGKGAAYGLYAILPPLDTPIDHQTIELSAQQVPICADVLGHATATAFKEVLELPMR
jgi:hypothetical protein